MFSIKITDSGAGIPENLIEKLFCDFGNLDVHKKENPEGRGLGLSICKMIVEQMDGKIKVDSEIGVGTTFTIMIETLCLIEAEEDHFDLRDNPAS